MSEQRAGKPDGGGYRWVTLTYEGEAVSDCAVTMSHGR